MLGAMRRPCKLHNTQRSRTDNNDCAAVAAIRALRKQVVCFDRVIAWLGDHYGISSIIVIANVKFGDENMEAVLKVSTVWLSVLTL